MKSLLFFLFLVISAPSITFAQRAWVVEPIEPGSFANTSVIIDSTDNVHVSYYDNMWSDLKYATNSSGSWVTEIVDDSSRNIGRYSSIGIDSLNEIHISYHDATNSSLKHAWNNFDLWITETVDDNVAGFHTSLDVDSSDNIHISYGTKGASVKYASNVLGSWLIETIDDNIGAALPATSIGLDSFGLAHIAYSGSGNLNYATNSSGRWINEAIDDDRSVGYFPSMAIDSQNNIHISYRDDYNQALKYVTNASGFWDYKTIDDDTVGGYPSSIAIDSSDNAHISYYDYLRSALKYATNDSGVWMNEVVESDGLVGNPSSIAIDSEDRVHIIYFDRENWVLKHAISVYDNDGDGIYDLEDCDDNDPNSYPNAAEICDSKDNDCDGNIPTDEVDNDSDSYMICAGDCNDEDADINPDAYELPGNIIDENCDASLGDCDPSVDWKNHGQYVRCVAHETDALIDNGILTEEEGDALISSASQSDVGKK